MSPREQVLAAELMLSVGAAWFVYSYVYKRVRLDVLRERLFTIRDDLFDFMVEHELPFETPAYTLLRSSLNGMIGSARDGSFNFITFSIYLRGMMRTPPAPRVDKVLAAVQAISDSDVRTHFFAVHEQIGRLGVMHIWLEGPLSFVLVPALALKLKAWGTRSEEMVEFGINRARQEETEEPCLMTA